MVAAAARSRALVDPGYQICLASQVALLVKNLPAIAGDIKNVGSIPGSGRSLEENMATHSSILAWTVPWTEELGGLPSIWSQRVGHDWGDLACPHTKYSIEYALWEKSGYIISKVSLVSEILIPWTYKAPSSAYFLVAWLVLLYSKPLAYMDILSHSHFLYLQGYTHYKQICSIGICWKMNEWIDEWIKQEPVNFSRSFSVILRRTSFFSLINEVDIN